MASRNRGQRIAIWIIAIVMTIGTIGSFAVIILSNNNQQTDQTRFKQLSEEYSQEYDVYSKQLESKSTELSETYFDLFNQYAGRVGEFKAADVTELEVVNLKEGDGAEIQEGQNITAYYLGWTPDGKIFDGSINDQLLKAPLVINLNDLIAGWTQGIPGMKEGGVRELTIPSSLAYGESGSGSTIPPSTPLKFILMVIPTLDGITEPEAPDELIRLYEQGIR